MRNVGCPDEAVIELQLQRMIDDTYYVLLQRGYEDEVRTRDSFFALTSHKVATARRWYRFRRKAFA
jgi:hypothetical protein